MIMHDDEYIDYAVFQNHDDISGSLKVGVS